MKLPTLRTEKLRAVMVTTSMHSKNTELRGIAGQGEEGPTGERAESGHYLYILIHLYRM